MAIIVAQSRSLLVIVKGSQRPRVFLSSSVDPTGAKGVGLPPLRRPRHFLRSVECFMA